MNPLYALEDVAEELEEAKDQADKLLAKEIRTAVASLRAKLEDAADAMARLGKIHNIPYAKREWVEGE